MQEKTIFQKIYDSEIPSNTIYKDADMIAFLDINPVTKGHTLLVSKEPYRLIDDVPEELISRMMIKSQEIIKKIKSVTMCEFVMVVIEGIEVPHFHIHLIPRNKGDQKTHFEHEKYEEGETETLVEKLKLLT